MWFKLVLPLIDILYIMAILHYGNILYIMVMVPG